VPAIKKTEFANALSEARRPYRLMLLRLLAELEPESRAARYFPLPTIVGETALHAEDVRNALRGLYKAGLIDGIGCTYRLTQIGRAALRRLRD
jgi:RIO-like serine/threonine protein kinase